MPPPRAPAASQRFGQFLDRADTHFVQVKEGIEETRVGLFRLLVVRILQAAGKEHLFQDGTIHFDLHWFVVLLQNPMELRELCRSIRSGHSVHRLWISYWVCW